MLVIPNTRDPSPRGYKASKGRKSGQCMSKSWTDSADNLREL